MRFVTRERTVSAVDGVSFDVRFTIAETLAEPLLLHGKATRKNADEKVCELLAQVGLDTELRTRCPHEFSGGRRQRVSIARASRGTAFALV